MPRRDRSYTHFWEISEQFGLSRTQRRGFVTARGSFAGQVQLGGTAHSIRDVAKILLLDGNSLAYRAFFALPTDMATASGQVTNAVFGFTSMLINLLKDHKPDGIMVAFDRPEPTFRHDMNVEYKAQREA